MEAPLLCCFFAQFDNQAGPRVTTEQPDAFLAPEFEEVSKVVIPKPFLCGSLVSIVRPRYTVVGFPVLMRDPKYHRNALLFNFGFVLRLGVPSEPYQPLLRKVAESLRAMEQETAFVSSASNLPAIRELCAVSLRDLNALGECTVRLDAANTIFLKLQRRLEVGPPPPAHGVPVAVVPLTQLDTASWDLTVRRVAQGIDGQRCIRDIAKRARIDVPLVAHAVKTLMAFGCVSMTQPNLSCNRYACTDRASSLCWSELGKACCVALGISQNGLPRVALLYARLRLRRRLLTHSSHASSLSMTRLLMFSDLCVLDCSMALFDACSLLCILLLRLPSSWKCQIDQYLVREGLPLDDHHFTVALERFSSDPQHIVLWK